MLDPFVMGLTSSCEQAVQSFLSGKWKSHRNRWKRNSILLLLSLIYQKLEGCPVTIIPPHHMCVLTGCPNKT